MFTPVDNSLENVNKWTKLGVVTSTTSLNLPENFEELLIDFFVYGSTENIHVPIHMLKEMIPDNLIKIYNGVMPNGYGRVGVKIDNSSIILDGVNYGQTNVTANSIATVYYK